jgi:hypothetical protein
MSRDERHARPAADTAVASVELLQRLLGKHRQLRHHERGHGLIVPAGSDISDTMAQLISWTWPSGLTSRQERHLAALPPARRAGVFQHDGRRRPPALAGLIPQGQLLVGEHARAHTTKASATQAVDLVIGGSHPWQVEAGDANPAGGFGNLGTRDEPALAAHGVHGLAAVDTAVPAAVELRRVPASSSRRTAGAERTRVRRPRAASPVPLRPQWPRRRMPS